MTINPTFINPSDAARPTRTDSRRGGRMTEYDNLIVQVIANSPQVAVIKAEPGETVRSVRLRVAQAITRYGKAGGAEKVDSWTGPDGSVYIQAKGAKSEPTADATEATDEATEAPTRNGGRRQTVHA